MTIEYLQQNFYIAACAHAMYAFGFFRNNTQMKSATGWMVEFAKQLGCPIFAFGLIDRHWYKYNTHTKTFHCMGGGHFPLLYKKSVIVGTRIANGYPEWKTALARLFERTLACQRPHTPMEKNINTIITNEIVTRTFIF